MKITRREFLKGSACTIAGVTAASLLSGCTTGSSSNAFEETIEWNNEYDVVVVGFGAAGGASAITAANEGAKVLLLDKAPKMLAGGNSRVCGQRICTVEKSKVNDAIEYIKAMRGGFSTPSDAIIEAYANEMAENEAWVSKELKQSDWTSIGTVDFPEYPGAGSIINKTTMGTKGWNAQTYHGFQERVNELSDSIDLWYSANCYDLVQDPETKIIHGVKVSIEGQDVLVRAKNGVILCNGGFENNKQMIQDYCVREHLYSIGNANYNTGDGIRMAAQAGANLWHLGNLVVDFEILHQDIKMTTFAAQMGVAKRGAIFVGLDGKRFMNESSKNHHGKIDYHGEQVQCHFPLNMFAIMDSAMFGNGKLHKSFSEHGKKELEVNTIVTADTLEGLAEKLGVDPVGLVDQVTLWNQFIDMGIDYEFGRKPTTKFTEGPYYAVQMVAGIVNTMGGPKRDEHGQILDNNDQPIPHLYAAGELGDIWPRDYQGSCNFGGGMIYGRISGRNAAKVKEDVSQDTLVKTSFVPTPAKETEYECASNQYIGQGYSLGGTPIMVRVTVEDETISNVEVLSHSETPKYSDNALASMPQAIIDANSTEIDTITGGTNTSIGIMNAVNDALSKK